MSHQSAKIDELQLRENENNNKYEQLKKENF